MAARDPAAPLEIVGLVPAAGRATRLGPLPCSKEILPLGPMVAAGSGPTRPRVAAEGLLDQLAGAGVGRAWIVLASGKWDVPAFLGARSASGVDLAYRILPSSGSVVETLDAAWAFLRGHPVALGFPDVLLSPADALARVVERHRATDEEVTLGLFPTDRPDKSDMVATGDGGRVTAIRVKPEETELELTWMLAVWSPAFGDWLHDYARRHGAAGGRVPPGGELHPGTALGEALAEGIAIGSVAFPDGSSLDIGTPDELARVLGRGNPEAETW